MGDIAQIVDSLTRFTGHFIKFRLRDAEAQQIVVYPARQRIGAIEDANIVAIRQIKLKKETVILQRVAGRRVHFAQRFRQFVTKGQAFVRQVVKQRLPRAVAVSAAQHATDQTVHFSRGQTHALLVK
ncbi:hypothetical protein D3C86_1680570 [compost metagenome]